MGLDGKKDVHLDGSSAGAVSRLEVLEGPSGRRGRSEAERARIAAESLLPGAQVSEVAREHGATRWLRRGLENVRAEFSLTALVYNLRIALNILGTKALLAAVHS